MATEDGGKMADVVVVYGQQEYYLQAAVESDDSLNIDLLQCQVLSLMGLLPEHQTLVASNGKIITSPSTVPSMSPPLALRVPLSGEPVRLFAFNATNHDQFLLQSDWKEICTRCSFGDTPVVQSAFRAVVAGDTDTLICAACATTCTTDTQMVTPLDWRSSSKLAERFISEICVVAGEYNTPPPQGFVHVPGDLNFSASGDFIHLFMKRGGPRAITQVIVSHEPHASTKTTTPHLVDINSGNASDTAVFLSSPYSVASSHPEHQNTYAITDLAIITGEDAVVPPGFIKIAKNLNEGALDARVQPVYLCYKLSPLGGFVCALQHGAFGECLFKSRHAASSSTGVASGHSSPLLINAALSLIDARQRADNSFLEAHYKQHEPAMRNRLQGGLDRARSYEDPRVQAEALTRIPVELLHERARANPAPRASYQDELVMQLTHWFKKEFFTWMNQPKCSACSFEKTRAVRTDPPSTPEEKAGHAGRVEVYQCPQCQAFTRFPRYNDPVKLLDTRTGRCGEWANCFTLCCRAMGFEARYVLDVTDHVWTEVYSPHLKRWLHCDSCEDQLDCPLTYEVGWGKKLSYIFSFAHDHVVDTAQRYTQTWSEMQQRRTDVDEKWLATTILAMNQRVRATVPQDRIAILDARAEQERQELQSSRQASATELEGRVSGSNEWKSQRSEDGKAFSGATAAATGGTVTASQISGSLASVSTTEITQALLKVMLLGCDRDGADACPNPRCLHKRAQRLSSNLSPTDRAALALQEVAALQAAQWSPSSLAGLLCPPEGEIGDFILSNDPEIYLPLQDEEGRNSAMIDISGYDNHAQSDAPRRKPFRIATADGHESRARGLQLLPGTSLRIASSTPSSRLDKGFLLSWLIRFDSCAFTTGTKSSDEEILVVRLGGSSTSLVVLRQANQTEPNALFVEARVQDKPTVRSSSSSLRTGTYYHLSIQANNQSGEIAMFVNAKEVVRIKIDNSTSTSITHSDANASQLITFEHGSAGPATPEITTSVISHVALLAISEEPTLQRFNDKMKQCYVCWPPLQAFDSTCACPTKTCAVHYARPQSGYRVARVRLWGSQFFDGIQLVYERKEQTIGDTLHTTSVNGPLIGNTHAQNNAQTPTADIPLLLHEFLTKISGRKGAWTDCLCVETNFGRKFTCGGNGGGHFQVQTPSAGASEVEIRAVAFDVGDHLVDAVAFVSEAPPVKSSEPFVQLTQILETDEPTTQHAAIRAAKRYLENISSSPHELKFQKIRASNNFFMASVGSLHDDKTQEAFMKWCGFEKTMETNETFYKFCTSPPAGDASGAAAMRIYFLNSF